MMVKTRCTSKEDGMTFNLELIRKVMNCYYQNMVELDEYLDKFLRSSPAMFTSLGQQRELAAKQSKGCCQQESYCVDQKGSRNAGVSTFVYEEAVKHAKNFHARYLQVFVKQNPKLIRATKHPRRAIVELKFPPKWLEEKHTSTNLADQPDEDKEEPAGEYASVAPKVPTVTSLSSNLEGFKKRMVDHITASIGISQPSHNKASRGIKVIQQIRDCEIALPNNLLS
ncbi:hypothetical protein J1N35_040155 [Gossypium stocksii]|uniref:Uncharacterized protein n=1 Tax=Gossypium stocksii TaxID=47602 RepID=A0A9D3ZI34_9ROSI|nr:hypothetical protein J1N35_040155 [Gossypium stocksii]